MERCHGPQRSTAIWAKLGAVRVRLTWLDPFANLTAGRALREDTLRLGLGHWRASSVLDRTMPRYELLINGKTEAVQAPADMPLVWVLRDLVGLLGTKPGCGIGACGSCFVLVDGVAKPSCQLAVGKVGPAKITTIEGLDQKIRATLEKAWIEEDVVQCGYCQPGQLLSAAALLTRTPRPSDDDINASMVNICRCGTYNRIRRAIKRASGGG